jgi:L-threonylcarbamoyladenylate synthase
MKRVNDFKNLEEIIETLSGGGIIIFPCETVYGVAVDSQNPEAVKKLNEYKKRPFGKPYAIMVSSQEMAEKYVDLNETAKNLYKNFLPGPLTVISKSKGKVAPGIESEIGTLGVRVPDYPDMLTLIEKFGRPIVATSANASYQKRPYKIDDILENISDKQKELVDLIIDVGELPHNEPSTVIDTTMDDPAILRQGEIKLKDKNEILSRSEENTQNIGKELWQKYQEFARKRAIVFALEGQMGAGKTQFVKGLAKAMSIEEQVVSPTYDLESSYTSEKEKVNLVHIDTWRMSDAREFEELGVKNFVTDKSVLAIEWADKVTEEIRKYREDAIIIWVKIEYGKTENERLLSWGVL